MAIWLIPRAEATESITPTREGELIFRKGADVDNLGRLQVGIITNPQDTNPIYEFRDINETVIPDGTITLDQIADLDENSIVYVDDNGRLQTASMSEGTLFGRDIGGSIIPQKLKESMVEDGSIPLDKLPGVQPGQVLGVLPSTTINPNDEPVQAINISDFVGSTITSSENPPDNPEDNDLWYYCGQQDGDNARLYIYQDNLWVDASPPILNTEPGPEGPQGAGVEAVVVGDRQPDDDIVLEFYNSTETTSENLINSVTISLEDITVGTGLPSAPASQNDYILRVAAGGASSWSPAGNALSDVTRQSAFYTITQEDITTAQADIDNNHLTLVPADFESFDTGVQAPLPADTIVSPLHTLNYQGFGLVSADDYFYIPATTTSLSTLIIHAGVIAVLEEDETLDLTNFVSS